MIDISPTLVGKSERLNADDLIGHDKRITITAVKLSGKSDQPLAIHYEEEEGKPYYPCRTMRRVIADLWGTDGRNFPGRQLLLYRDANVTYGGKIVGGIRIKAASHITQPVTCTLTIGNGKKGRFTILPLQQALQQAKSQDTRNRFEEWSTWFIAQVNECADPALLEALLKDPDIQNKRDCLRQKAADIEKKIAEAIQKKRERISSYGDE